MKNKVIVITGATGGVGKEAVKFFLSKNYTVIGLSRNKEKLEILSQEINNEFFYFYKLDIRNHKKVKVVFKEISNSFSRIDILINNASVFEMKKLVSFSTKEINNIIDTNLKGTIFCTLECIKIMKEGRIINISSVSGTHGIENQAVYSSSKYGVNGFAESLNQEIIKQGISISTICPGGIDTPLWNKNNQYPGEISKILKSSDIVNMMDYIINLPNNVMLKTVTMFPVSEWH